ncbi:MAG: TetR/AcrR family transcriptional regulator [Oscillospiraceae bacterium]|nr:TetR/AcrR family transcriptional regulator [Oscillospiraceae bacterium]
MTKAESKYFNTAARMDEAFLALLEEKNFEYITVKEICKRAGVNRSTFYLHYETIGDLLLECISMREQFLNSYDESATNFIRVIKTAPLEQLFLITPKYLIPYLSYIKTNKTAFKVTVTKPEIMAAGSAYDLLFTNIISPILERYGVPDDEREYMMSFYIDGLIGIIKQWIKLDCTESVERIAEIMIKIIRR